MAVHVAPAVKPVTVKVAGTASDADAETGDTAPLEQVRPIVTDAVLCGLKVFCTWKVALVWVLVIAQLLVCPVVMPTPAHALWLAM